MAKLSAPPTRLNVRDDLAERRAARLRTRRPTRYTFGCGPPAPTAPPESALARLGQQLERQGLTPAQQLDVLVALPDDLWDAVWAQLREHIESERAA
ncbi:MAG: hypothetical protein ACR2LK_07695 [Solirubrobacteraceae bacterium]